VAGDHLEIEVSISAGAACSLTTQSATKVYRSPDGRAASQSLRARVGSKALLVLAPDPLMLFRDAVYQQRLQIEVEAEGSLVAIDGLTSGRREHGECWAFRRFESRLDVRYAGERCVADGLLLSSEQGPIDGPFRLGRFHSLATAVIVGDALADAARQVCQDVAREPVGHRAELIEAASPIRHGAMLKILGTSPEAVTLRLRQRLGFLASLVTEAPWARKW
jgi:urease accessory protein